MICSLESLKRREVIDIKSGERLGFIDDVEINLETSEAAALIIYGRERLFGLLGRESDIIIPCSSIEVIGEEVLLISSSESKRCAKSTKIKRNLLESLFG